MDLEKIGKLISDRRRKLGLSQKDIADKLGITDKAVSKWERGINAPDIGYLNELSKLLQISLQDLLSGEVNYNKDMSIQTIEFYNKKSKVKYAKRLIITIVLCIVIFIGYSIANNYNKFMVYDITSDNSDFVINGYLIANREQKIFAINDIEYIDNYAGTSKAIIIKELEITLKLNNKIITSFHYDISDQGTVFLDEFLMDKSIYFDEKINNHENIILTNRGDLLLELVYTSPANEKDSLIVPLNIKMVK